MEQSEAAEVGKGQAMQGLGGTDLGISSKILMRAPLKGSNQV